MGTVVAAIAIITPIVRAGNPGTMAEVAAAMP